MSIESRESMARTGWADAWRVVDFERPKLPENLRPLVSNKLVLSDLLIELERYKEVIRDHGRITCNRGATLCTPQLCAQLERLFSTPEPQTSASSRPLTWARLVRYVEYPEVNLLDTLLIIRDIVVQLPEDDRKLLLTGRPWQFPEPGLDENNLAEELKSIEITVAELRDVSERSYCFAQIVFPECSVKTWFDNETAVVRGKGWILGHIGSIEQNVSQYGQQKVSIVFNETAESRNYQDEWETDWILRATGEPIQDGDVVCLMQGASKPSIVRMCKDHFSIIASMVTPQQRRHGEPSNEMPRERLSTDDLCDVLLTLKIPQNGAKEKGQSGFALKLIDLVPHDYQEDSEVDKRLTLVASVMVDIVTSILKIRKSESNLLETLLHRWGAKCAAVQRLATDPAKDGKYAAADVLWSPLRNQEKGMISEEFVKGVAMNKGLYGYIIMALLLEQLGKSLPVSEDVAKSAAGNSGLYGLEIMELLFRYREDSLPVSEDVVKAAAGNTGFDGGEIMELLFRHRRERLPVSEDVVKIAAGNTGKYGHEIMEILFQWRKERLLISEEVVKEAARNPGFEGYRIMEILFRHRRERLPVSEEVVKEAAGNPGLGGHKIMEVLFRHQESLPVSEDVVKAAAVNTGPIGPVNMQRLFQYRGKTSQSLKMWSRQQRGILDPTDLKL
ncbi:hypothetical protein BBP40_005413 [Aspergillus hancockii]|nr:hypothetical protein BBP40_005413 [Aspergillus hancockii]